MGEYHSCRGSAHRALLGGVLLVLAAGAALLVGWARPAPWLLTLILLLLLVVTWAFAFVRWLREGSLINERPAG